MVRKLNDIKRRICRCHAFSPASPPRFLILSSVSYKNKPISDFSYFRTLTAVDCAQQCVTVSHGFLWEGGGSFIFTF